MLNSVLLKYCGGVVAILGLLNSCQSSSGSGQQPVPIGQSSVQNRTYVNPVFEPILADPTVVRNPQNKLFHAYGTADNWGDGKGPRLVSILQSKDLVHWSWIGTAFSVKPNWETEGGIWAPDLVFVNGKYVM